MAEPRTSISPTAHYTGAVWARHGLSHPALSTPAGGLMYWSVRPTMAVVQGIGGARLEDLLLARHLLIDRLLESAIGRGEVTQVIEIAAGMSPRGWRFAARHGESLTYIETDLPTMAARKRQALERAGSLSAGHRVEALDALSDEGEQSLGAIAAGLDEAEGVAVITEGLLPYLDRPSTLGLWRRVASCLAPFPHVLMLSDLHLAHENSGLLTAIGTVALSAFVRGRVRMHFVDEAAASAALLGAGFAAATLHRGSEVSDARGADGIRVIEASM